MASPSSLAQGKDSWHAYITKKTEAMPKNTLFGTVLEKVDPGAVAAIDSEAYQKKTMKERQDKANQYKHQLPDRLKNTAAVEVLENERNELSKQEEKVTERQKLISDMESKARYFQSLPPSLNKKNLVNKKMLLAEPGLDFELTKKMNTVGYPEKNDYNRERKRVRPPVHKYAVIGDPLEYGMDFSLHHTETQEKYDAPKSLGQQHIFHRNVQKERPSSLPAHSAGNDGIPANIKAFYGSRLIDQLFSDKEAMERVKGKMEMERRQQLKAHQKVELPVIEVATPRNYGDLSHNLRQDKFSGYTFHKPTLMKETYTQEVFDRRYKDPDEFRHQWDEYGKWKDQEILRDRLDKDFQQYMESQVKLEPNWDRNAVVPRPKKVPVEKPAKKPKPPPRKKPRPNPPAEKGAEPIFEDVQFITPPMTPEYLPPPPAEITPATNKPDDEFWKFYDQGLPKIR